VHQIFAWQDLRYAQARERAKERKITVTQAMSELARMDPAGHQKWVESQGPLPVI
jgi:hypothetical protein